MTRGDKRPDRGRIFGIGLNKTGTTSLHHAMTMLGYKSLHWGGPDVAAKVQSALDADQPLLANLDQRFDVFSDVGLLSRRFALLDRQYFGSRFVLTVRPIDDWVDSRRRHVQRNIVRRATGDYTGSFLEVDEPKWRAEWETHIERVTRYFEGRTDLLAIDITTGPGWEPICEFLGNPIPDLAFPWENRQQGSVNRLG